MHWVGGTKQDAAKSTHVKDRERLARTERLVVEVRKGAGEGEAREGEAAGKAGKGEGVEGTGGVSRGGGGGSVYGICLIA